MRNTRKETPNRLWLYLSIIVVILGVLLYLIFTQAGTPTISPTSNPLTRGGTADTNLITHGSPTITVAPIDGARNNNGNNPSDQAPTSPSSQQSGQGSSDNDPSNITTPRGSYVPLGCSTNLQKVCTIKKDDELYGALGQSPDSELLVNGVKVKPDKIVYQTSLDTYNDEQMKDGQGKVLSSTKKEFDPNTKTLTIIVGVNPDYYDNLKPTEQRLLYLSQTVRSFMAMFGETPENFVKVDRVVGTLGSWQPTP